MSKRKIYVYSSTNDYMEQEYVDKIKSSNAELYKGTVESLKRFIKSNDKIQLDTETNVTEHYTKRDLYVVQLGTYNGDEQHIIDYPDREEYVFDVLSDMFKSDMVYLAHNAKFEYIVLYKHFKIYLNNFKDTFLASKLITAGLELPKGYNGLASLIRLTFGVDLSKAQQTTFDGLKMTPEQLLYADFDVVYLGKLLDRLYAPLKKWNLLRVFNLENKSIRPIGDLTINGILVNTDALDENIDIYDKNAATSKKAMINAFMTDKADGVQDKLREIGVIQKEDEIVINWNSTTQKKKILQYFYPEVEIKSTAKKILEGLEKTVDDPAILTKLLNKDTDSLNMLLVSRHLNFLLENDMFIAKGNLNLNFSSPDQLKSFFRVWYPNLQSTGVKALKKLKHPVVLAYKKYTKHKKMVSSFGRNMYDFIEEDGRMHANFNALTRSGSRMSSSKPNQQQAPSTEEYRRMYIPRPGWKLVDSDYASAELYIAAYLSKDPILLEAIKNKYDLHSFSAYHIFGDKWIDAGGSATPVGKPNTKEANGLRKMSKGLSFSLLYGTGVQAFSENSGISVAEGKILMDTYFKTFPKLADFFKQSGKDALTYNYIREPHFNRVRFFNKPKNGMEASHNKNAGMNYKPQSINMSITKYAMCLIKKYIDDNDLDDKVKMLLTVHDQLTSEVIEDFAEEWAVQQTRLMEKATLFVIPDGTLKAETDILDHWTKG